MKVRGMYKSLLLGGMVLVLSACGPKKISTINPVLQDSLTAMMERKMEEIVAHSGQAIIMEVQTGEIKAMVGEGKPLSSSLMRTVSLLAALESGKVKLSDMVDTKDTEDSIVERTSEVSLQRECSFRTGEKEKKTHMQSTENPDCSHDLLA